MNVVELIINMWQLALQGKAEGIPLWIAGYAFVVCGYSIIFQVRTRRRPATNGQLIDFKIEIFGADELVIANQ